MGNSSEQSDDGMRPLRSAAMQTANSVLVLQRRAQQELLTAKQRLEERTAELARSVAILEATFDSSPDAILAVDLQGNIVAHNRRFAEMWAISDIKSIRDHGQLTLRIAQFMVDPAAFLARVTEAANRPESELFDTIDLRDGRSLERHSGPQRIDGNCVGIVITWRDITAHRQVEADLKASQDRFRTLWETATDAVVMLDEEGRIHYANEALREIFGHDPSHVLGQNISSLQPHRLREVHRRGMERYIKSRQKKLNWRATETVGLHSDGREIPIEISFTHIESKGTHLFAGFLRDISERKKAELAREDLEEQLRESQKMEAIGTLAGGIAHDFNNILGAILGNVSLARSDGRLSEATRISLDEIQKAGVRAKNLIQQILAFSRKQPQEFRNQSLQPLIVETVGLLRATLPAAVQVVTILGAEPIHVMADTTQIEQVLMNLCTNAWQALKAGAGSIVVKLDEVWLDADSAQSLGSLNAGRFARLSVTDDGHGMDEATRARVFEPFYTTKEIHKGTGLGLAVAHGIVAAHAGAISVRSRVGAGSTFEVYLRTVIGVPQVADPDPPSIAAESGDGKHILYVDDDEAMVFLVHRLLTLLGFKVSAFEKSSDAIAAVRAAPASFDLVVSDYNMPGASGLDVARTVAAIRPNLPVIITSGYINEQLQEGARAVGVRHLIHKPNTVDELCSVLQRVIQGKAETSAIVNGCPKR